MQRRDFQLRQSLLTIWLAVFTLAPVFFSATTFRPNFETSSYLGFAFPILACELGLVLMAFANGMRPVPALARLGRPTLVAALVWLISVSYVAFVTAPVPFAAQVFLAIALVHALFAFSLSDRIGQIWGKERHRFVNAIGLGSAYYCIFTYFVLLTFRNDYRIDWMHIGAGVSNLRQFAFYGLTSAAVGAGLILTAGEAVTKLEKLRNFSFVLVGSGMCFWSGGRGGAGALLIVILTAIAIARSGRRRQVASKLLVPVVAGLVVSSIWLPSEPFGGLRIFLATSFSNGDFNQFTTNRFQMWKETLQLVSARPFLGYGLGQFKFLVTSSLHLNSHPHNSIFQFLLQWGTIGTTAVVVMAQPALRSIAPVLRAQQDKAAVAAALLIIGHFVMSLVEGNLFHVYPTAIIVIALVVVANSGAPERDVP